MTSLMPPSFWDVMEVKLYLNCMQYSALGTRSTLIETLFWIEPACVASFAALNFECMFVMVEGTFAA